MNIGFSKRDITPEVGVFLAGNGDFKSTRINDPLHARAVVVQRDSTWIALVSCDLIGINPSTVEEVRDALRDEPGVQTENIFISCTHTHNGPTTRFIKKPTAKHRDPSYMARLSSAIADAILEAHNNLSPATIHAARGAVYENFNRRLVTADGNAHFYNPRTLRENPEYAELTSGVTDNEVNAIQFKANDGSTLLTMINYAAHPLTVGIFEHVISRDFCGVLVDEVEAATNAPAIFFQGACGDLHNKGLFAGFERQQEMGKNLANETLRILSQPHIHDPDPEVAVARTRLELPIDEERLHNGDWEVDYFTPPYTVEMAAVKIGPIAFATLPGEVCCGPGLQIKWNSPFTQTWLLYNCNAYSAYIVLPRARIEGGYEGNNNCLTADAGQRVVTTSLDLCRELQ